MASETPQGTHFWLLTIQWPGDANTTGTYSGVWTPASGMTRMDAFKYLLERVAVGNAGARGGTVLAFDLHPNEL